MNDTPKWYHKAIVIIMMLSIFPTVLFQLHLVERLTLQDDKLEHEIKNIKKEYGSKYKRMQEVTDNLEKKFFPKSEYEAEEIIKEGAKFKRLKLIYNKKYRKEHKAKFGL